VAEKLMPFFSFEPQGHPEVDLGHVVNCLNKLDAESPENCLLTSRDEDTLMVASYAELARCLKACFAELTVHRRANAQRNAQQSGYQGGGAMPGYGSGGAYNR
jgi:hypothetical protein